MAPKLRWFKFFPGDWALSTQGMTPLAKGLYIDMLCMQWAGRRLPAAYGDLSMMMPAMTELAYRELLQHFDAVDGWLVNRRLEDERNDAERRSDNGQRGAAAKWSGGSGNAPSDAAAMRTGMLEHMPHHMQEHMQEQCHTDTEAEADTEAEEEEEEQKSRKRATAAVQWDSQSGFTGVTDIDRSEWAEAYGDIDVDEEILRAHQHLKTNTEKRYRNYRRYLGNWMARAQRYVEERIARAQAAEEARSRPAKRDESHIPDDVHPDDKRLFFTPEGKPRTPLIWRRKDGSCSIE